MFNKINSIIVVAVSVTLFYLYKTETDFKSVSAVSYVFRDINRCELFYVVTQPDTVSSWFRWVKHFRSADEKPLGVGKLYQAYYDSEQPVIFQVVHYDPCTAIVLESDCLLKPRIELRTMYVTKRKSKLLISIQFRRPSALFQYYIYVCKITYYDCTPTLYQYHHPCSIKASIDSATSISRSVSLSVLIRSISKAFIQGKATGID